MTTNKQYGTADNAVGRRFDGLVALVTGGGTGIGEAAARRIAAEGGKVLVTGRRKELIDKVAADIGGIAVSGDTSDPAHLAEAVSKAKTEFGGLDVLVANAGISVLSKLEDTQMSDWHRAFTVNTEGVMLACQAVIPELRQRGGGSIVIVSSMAGVGGGAGAAPYMASKAATVGLGKSIATDYGVDNIRCNILCPGFAPTEMTKMALADLAKSQGMSSGEFFAEITQAIPLRRMADPAEMASVIAFLASSDASFMTGSVIISDGGGNLIDGSVVPILKALS
jgi:NAD(P)-dependent dehydrogenase (short-subunit alcohol dehydrogenase family)